MVGKVKQNREDVYMLLTYLCHLLEMRLLKAFMSFEIFMADVDHS